MLVASLAAAEIHARSDAVSAGIQALEAASDEAAVLVARRALRVAITDLAAARLSTPPNANSTQRRHDAPLKQRRLDLLNQAERAMAASHERLRRAA